MVDVCHDLGLEEASVTQKPRISMTLASSKPET